MEHPYILNDDPLHPTSSSSPQGGLPALLGLRSFPAATSLVPPV